jgi:hypothetical protein
MAPRKQICGIGWPVSPACDPANGSLFMPCKPQTAALLFNSLDFVGDAYKIPPQACALLSNREPGLPGDPIRL